MISALTAGLATIMPKTSKKQLTETDLYQPIHQYLVDQGYTVRSEVANCDIAAARNGELIVIELKRSFNTALLIQAARRQRAADSVYVAVPRPKCSRRWNDIKHLLRRLELGLIFVSFRRKKPTIDVVFHPLPFQRRRRKRAKQAILTEMAGRSGDFNQGGSTRRKLVTAYREKAIHIACCLEGRGPFSPRELRARHRSEHTVHPLQRLLRLVRASCPRTVLPATKGPGRTRGLSRTGGSLPDTATRDTIGSCRQLIPGPEPPGHTQSRRQRQRNRAEIESNHTPQMLPFQLPLPLSESSGNCRSWNR